MAVKALYPMSKPLKYTIKDLRADFPNEDACLEWLFKHLHPDGVTCKKCGVIDAKHYRMKNRRAYACAECGNHLYPTAGTIFHKSRTPLTDWFHAIYMMSTNKAGTSAKQIERELGVTYKTAWRMMHQIRKLMGHSDEPFSGEVEMDETFIHANTFKRSSARKRYGHDGRRTGMVVAGMIERGGGAKVWHIKAAGARVLQPLVKNNVQTGTIVHTDGFMGYRKLSRMGFDHRWTDHGKGEYYTPDSYTQNIENLWSHFKRGIRGVYRHIGDRYVQAYANEFAWRYSHRKDERLFYSLLKELRLATL